MSAIRVILGIIFLLGALFWASRTVEALNSGYLPFQVWITIGLLPCIVGAVLGFVLLKGAYGGQSKTISPGVSKYETLLTKLNEKYVNGEVSPKIYEKLRKEYQMKIGALNEKYEEESEVVNQ